jgi:hypothetical protein
MGDFMIYHLQRLFCTALQTRLPAVVEASLGGGKSRVNTSFLNSLLPPAAQWRRHTIATPVIGHIDPAAHNGAVAL